jgi:putative ABC transport system permease protein
MQGEKITDSFTLRFLKWFCPDHLYEEIEGDLVQNFNRDEKIFGEKKARRRLIWDTIRFFRPGVVLRREFSLNITFILMFKSNLTFAFRQIKKDRVFFSINIFGLSISIAACILIFQYALFELNYDRYHPEPENLYRVATISYEDSQVRYAGAMSALSLAPALKEKFPEVAEAGRLFTTNNWFDCTLAHYDDSKVAIFNERNLYYADPSFLALFDYPFQEGDRSTALTKPFSIVLTESVARKYFGKEEALGKVLRLKGSSEDHDYTVTGILSDPRPDSHIDADIIASVSSLENNPQFKFFDAYTYIRLADELKADQFDSKLAALANELHPPVNKIRTELKLQPVKDIHLHSALQDEMKPVGNAKAIYFLLLVALVILLMAWINYINLTTSRSALRAKEVGIRKVSGATRTQIALQFLTETSVLNGIAIVCAILLVYFFAPRFYDFIGLTFPKETILTWNTSAEGYAMLAVFLLGIFLSGYFPAHIISSFNPVRVLKGKWNMTKSSFSVRKTAVVFQFACAIVLVILVVIFNQQFSFMREQNLHVDINNTIIVKAPVNVDSTYRTKLSEFKNHLKGLAIVHTSATSTAVPGVSIEWTGDIRKEQDESTQTFAINVIDPDFISTYKLRLLAGRNFEIHDFPIGNHFGNKLEPVILNRKGKEQLGFNETDDAIGATIYWGINKCSIVGIVDDFHQESLKEPIKPTLFTANTGPSLTLKLTTGANKEISQSLIQIRQAWNSYFPNNPFDYSFLEEDYNRQYARDEQVARLFHLFCLIALTISCLGLFALSLFSVNQRTKEISIRKVLGASALHLIRLLTSEYLLLILIAATVALPIAYIGATKWLQEFAFHINMNVWFYVLPIILILVVAFLTVGAQVVKVIIKHPSDTLKHE